VSIICHIDQTAHHDRAALHKHLRPLMKLESYYTQFEKRVDLATGESIPYKDAEQYLSQDFIDKRSIKRYIKEQPEQARTWAINWLRRRKEEKELVYAPSQVELRSLSCPSMPYFDSVGGYYTITQQIGYATRFLNETPKVFEDLTSATVIQDSREQVPLKLPLKTIVAKLDEADYGLAAPHDRGVYIERKGLGDFVGSMNCRKVTRKKGDDSSFERFDRELARAKEQGHYIVMLVEANINDALGFNYLPQMRWTKVSPNHVFHNLRDLLVKYPLSFQAVFADGRVEAARVAIKIFEMGDQVRRVDLQQAYERKLL
jgi:hypothetical protein